MNETKTSEGPVPHIFEQRTGYVFPVKLDFSSVTFGDEKAMTNLNSLMPPKRDAEGNLVYAVPGGSEFSVKRAS